MINRHSSSVSPSSRQLLAPAGHLTITLEGLLLQFNAQSTRRLKPLQLSAVSEGLLVPKIFWIGKVTLCIWIYFLPTSRKVLPTFQRFCPVGVQIAQTVVHFAHFQVQVRKKGVLGWALGCFVYGYISKRGVWQMSKKQGLGVVFWAKWDPIWAKWNLIWAKWGPSGQFVLKVGKSAIELGEKIQSYYACLQWRSRWLV